MSPTDAGTGTPPARAGSLRMRIERITFENIDVPSHQQARLHGAIEQELARLWRMRERAPEAGERERVRGGGLRVGGAIDVDAMAAEIAHSVHASLDAGQGAGA
ncbi:MAG: hypothetical protein KF800_14330 [Lysobacter sp.]|nr:hypothetical protein [Lysobacter sp.]